MIADIYKDQAISMLEILIDHYKELAKIFVGEDWTTYGVFNTKINALREAIDKISYL